MTKEDINKNVPVSGKISVREVCEFFWDVENRYSLLDWKIGNVPVWQYLRMTIYYKLAPRVGALDVKRNRLPEFSKIISRLGSVLHSCTVKNPFLRISKADVLVFEHTGYSQIDNKNIDRHTHYLVEELRKNGTRFYTFDKPFHLLHMKTGMPERRHTDFIVIVSELFSSLLGRINEYDKDIIGKIDTEIFNRFKTRIPIEKIITKGVGRFRTGYWLYSILLSITRPRKIYVIDAFSQKGDLVKCSKDRGIEIIEIQHGIFSRYHLGYSFPGCKKTLECFPDKFYVWGSYWRKLAQFPLSENEVVDYGYKYFENVKKRYAGIKKVPRQIAVISQGVIGKALAEVILSYMPKLSEYIIKYKLHPAEVHRWHTYPALVELSKMSNVTVLEQADLYEVLAQSEFQIGVFSTALFEGVDFGCKTILVDLPGREYIENLEGLITFDEMIMK